MRTTTYDENNGLVYSEVEERGSKGSGNWIIEYKTPQLVNSRLKPNNGPGVGTLSAMALNKIGTMPQELSVEALRALPWSFGQIIWERVCANHAESFYTWRIFATAYRHEFATEPNRYLLDIKTPTTRLTDYYRGLDSADLRWLTSLRISPKQISVPDLVAVATISNLTVLDLSDGQLYIENRESNLDQRIFRTWAELARSGRAFGQLRVLLLGWQEKIGSWIFDMLTCFPKLDTVVMTDCRHIHHKNSKDWSRFAAAADWAFWPTKRGVKHLRSCISQSSFGVSNVSYLYDSSNKSVSGGVDGHAIARERPIVECWLGTPRVWHHIVEDFPGTRTVFFQKSPDHMVSTALHKSEDTGPARSKTAENENKHPKKNAEKLQTRRRRFPQHSASSLLLDMNMQ